MYSSKDGNWFAIILRTGRLPSQMTQDDPGKNRVKRQQELPDAFVCSWCSPEGSGSPPHDPENPWELPKGPCCQAPPNMTPHRWECRAGTFREGKGKDHYVTATLIGQDVFPCKLVSFDLLWHNTKFLVVLFFVVCCVFLLLGWGFFICVVYFNECHTAHRHTMGPPPPDASQVPSNVRGGGQ